MPEMQNNRQSLWMGGDSVFVVQQNLLPFEKKIYECKTYWDTCMAITDQMVMGIGTITAAAGFAMAQAFLSSRSKEKAVLIREARQDIENTGPGIKGIAYAVDRVYRAGLSDPESAVKEAYNIVTELSACSEALGMQGHSILKNNNNVLVHGHSGWLSFMHKGTALSPVYQARENKKDIFVYVDEARPKGQGGHLTAWELNQEGVPHVIIPDNAAATLMSRGQINCVIVGADKISSRGDIVGKIGTLGRAILAFELGIPFFVAAPRIVFDPDFQYGKSLKMEERPPEEVLFQTGTDTNGNVVKVKVCAPGSKAMNPAYDITPARYITGIITEQGIVKPTTANLKKFMDMPS